MNVKKKARRVMSGLLTAVTVLSTVLSPAVAYASDDAGSVKKIPYYEEIKDQLDEDEVVTAKDYEIKVGDNFDVMVYDPITALCKRIHPGYRYDHPHVLLQYPLQS